MGSAKSQERCNCAKNGSTSNNHVGSYLMGQYRGLVLNLAEWSKKKMGKFVA